MNLEKRVLEIANEVVSDYPELFIVEATLKGNSGNQRFTLLLDGDDGVTIDLCSTISRKIARVVEEEDLFEGKYNLEVSSPGIDTPLKFPRQYKKNIGRTLKVELIDGDSFEGELTDSNDDEIFLGIEEDQRQVKIESIKKAKVKVSFN